MLFVTFVTSMAVEQLGRLGGDRIIGTLAMAIFSLKTKHFNNDIFYEIAFLMKSLHPKTLCNIVAKILSIKVMVFDHCGSVGVAGCQGVPIILSPPRQERVNALGVGNNVL